MASSASKRLEIIVAALCFLTGVSIYLLWRDEHLLIHRVLQACQLSPLLDVIRSQVADIYLPEWVRFALPDGLWSMSYILTIDALVKRDYLWTSVIPAIGILSELMQWLGWLPGTFDFCDLLAYGLPYLLYILIINQQNKTL